MNASETAFRSRWQMTVTALAPNHFRAPRRMFQCAFQSYGIGCMVGIAVAIPILDPIVVEPIRHVAIAPVLLACMGLVFHLFPPWIEVGGDANLSAGPGGYNTQMWVISIGTRFGAYLVTTGMRSLLMRTNGPGQTWPWQAEQYCTSSSNAWSLWAGTTLYNESNWCR